jgi:hypothetical protein
MSGAVISAIVHTQQNAEQSYENGSIHLLSHTSSWHSAQLIEHRENFKFTVYHSALYELSY